MPVELTFDMCEMFASHLLHMITILTCPSSAVHVSQNGEDSCGALQEQQQEHRQALDSLRSTLQRDADLAKEGLQAAEKQAGAADQQLATLHISLAASEDRQRAAESQAEVSFVNFCKYVQSCSYGRK